MRFVFDEVENIVCAAILLMMTFIGFANVVVRYLTSYSFAATQEFLLNGFLLLTVFGAAIAARRGEHLAVTLLSDLLPPAGRKVAILFASALSVLLLCLSAWFMFQLVQYQYRSGVSSSGLQIPAWYYNAGLPLGFVLVAIRLVEASVRQWRGLDQSPLTPDA